MDLWTSVKIWVRRSRIWRLLIVYLIIVLAVKIIGGTFYRQLTVFQALGIAVIFLFLSYVYLNFIRKPKIIEKGFAQIILLGAIATIVALVAIGFFLYQRGLLSKFITNPKAHPTPAPTRKSETQPTQAISPAQVDGKFDQSFVLKSISFTDSKGIAKKFIVYRKFRDDTRREYVDTYLTDENLTKSSAVKISRLSDPADGKHPNSGFGTSLFDNTATIDLSPGSGKKFIAVSYRVGDGESFLIIDESGLVNENILKNACDLVKNNYNSTDYTCFVEFDSWKDASKFYVKLLTVKSLSSGGSTFRILIDATTGKTIGTAEKI